MEADVSDWILKAGDIRGVFDEEGTLNICNYIVIELSGEDTLVFVKSDFRLPQLTDLCK